MKIEIIETFMFPPEIIFTALTDIKHYIIWSEGFVELIKLSQSPARLGTQWEHVSELLGRRLITYNGCNVYRVNQTFGWITEKPITSQVVLSLLPDKDLTMVSWSVESEATGIAQLTEPLLVRETKDRIQKSFSSLKIYLQSCT